ncbi:transmembrane exosortase [Leptospira weilii serovar Ranarum str. ICFT]|uniref:Transmembrane exosortase n=1 Tax=Leptospira weilii serovar Ranarum str. ICFT TaxID=1218598 RepID=N1WHB6_9LEPT|nr:exosortase N [Leptospira weilii]EMY78345.1 transmembrane exosortase [Leptospira weilii serovar Ranarum str. ICFT]
MKPSDQSIFLVGILVLVCVVPMLHVGQNLLSLRSVFELYPILFLPLLIRFEGNRENSNRNPFYKKTQDVENIRKLESVTQGSEISESSITKRSDLGTNIRKKNWLLLPGIIFVISGIFFQRLSLVWIGSFWNALAVLHISGITLTWPAPFIIFTIPPVTGFGSLFLGYKLRLIVTEMSVQIIRIADASAYAIGNQIFFQGKWFVVDRVCEGMKMGLASTLIAAAFISRSNRTGAILIGCFVFPFWFFSNFFRVCVLVLFQIPAGSWRHEFIGIILFICGIVVPLAFISLLFPKSKQNEFNFSNLVLRSPPKILWLILPLSTAISLAPINRFITAKSYTWPSKIETFHLDVNSTLSDHRIAVYRSRENYLILKRDLFAIGTGHDPRICFEAVGFSFTEQGEWDGVKTAELKSPSGEKPILLWWYSITENSKLGETSLAHLTDFAPRRAASDLEWRWKRLLGADVIQWNLYGPNEKELREIAERISKEPFDGEKDPTNAGTTTSKNRKFSYEIQIDPTE